MATSDRALTRRRFTKIATLSAAGLTLPRPAAGDQSETQDLRSELLMEMELEIATGRSLGSCQIAPITGGIFEGPRLRGTALAGGGIGSSTDRTAFLSSTSVAHCKPTTPSSFRCGIGGSFTPRLAVSSTSARPRCSTPPPAHTVGSIESSSSVSLGRYWARRPTASTRSFRRSPRAGSPRSRAMLPGTMAGAASTNAALLARDRSHLVHPLHDSKVHESGHVWVNGDGALLIDADGHQVIDGLAGLWNVTAGHGRTELAEAMRLQAETLGVLLRVQRELKSTGHRAGRTADRDLLPLNQSFLFHERRGRGHREQYQAGARLLEIPRATRQDQSDLQDRGLSWRNAGRDERHRDEPVLAAVRTAGSRLRAHPVTISISLRGAERDEPGYRRGERAGAGAHSRRA